MARATGAPRIPTARLVLRGWTDEDRAPFARMNADPVVTEHLLAPLTREASDDVVDRITACFADRGFGRWALERRSDGRLLGFTGLAVPAFEAHFTPCVEIAWRLAADVWGHGYATEAARAALTFGFVVAELDDIVAYASVHNLRSIAVMQRLGMQHDAVGDFDHPSIPAGHRLCRHVLYRARPA